ncbi:MAG: PKD domain-containing protein [Bacteroidia bacterium]|nr:PKD domain-containing protein [Bacteroidia bacterium]
MKLRQEIILRYFTAGVLVLSALSARSQLTAQFSTSAPSGCSPLIVSFYNSSTGAVGYNWDFGNGNMSVDVNPQSTFTNPGTYMVTLTAYNSSSSVTVTHQITVFPNPGAHFVSGTTSGCVGAVFTFSNFSTPGQPGNSPIVNSFWDFGDGNTLTSNTPTVTHIFTYSGDFTITLMVTDQNGCTDLKTINHYIHVTSPTVLFFTPVQNFCTIPDTVNFSNGSSGQNPLVYLWNFGNGGTSTFTAPQNIYSAYGDYTVSLTVTDGIGCISTLTLPGYIQIHPVLPSFNIPDTLCPGDIFDIQNTSTNANTYLWHINGDTTSVLNPQIISLSTGGYNMISLDASLNGACLTTHTDSVFVETIHANFEPVPPYLCHVTDSVHFINLTTTNNSGGNYSSHWEFGTYGQVSNLNSPYNTYYLTDTLQMTHTQVFTDMLIVTSQHGCIDTFINVHDVLIILLAAGLNATPWGGCAPMDVSYLDASWYDSPVDSIVQWHWNLDDGYTWNGPAPASHVYADTGLYLATLTITTALGCHSNSDTFPIQVGNHQHPDFTWIAPDTICSSTSVQFISLSTDANYINNYIWWFSDGINQYGLNPVHFPLDTGWLYVNLLVGQNMCDTDTTIYHCFYVKGPLTFMISQFDCSDPYHYNFFADSTYNHPINDVQHFYWDFGDGSPYDSLNIITSHEYTQSGNFDVVLYSSNDSTQCSYSDHITVLVRKPIAVIKTDTLKFCTYDTVAFYSGHSQDVAWFNYIWEDIPGLYQWNFDDGSIFVHDNLYGTDTIVTDTSITHIFTEPGIYNIRLIIQDLNGCRDTAYLAVRACAPNSAFIAMPDSGCIPLHVQFSDISPQDTTIASWEWKFGDNLASTSNSSAPSFIYTETGFYTVSLILTDVIGCHDTTIIDSLVRTSSPEINISLQGHLCIDDSVIFLTDTTVYNFQYHWSFGDGSYYTSMNPGAPHIFNNAGNYQVIVNAQFNGCTAIDTMMANVQDPSLEIVVNNHNSVCYPTVLSPTYTPDNPDFDWWIWSFGDYSFSMIQHPTHTYTVPGEYLITLSAQTTNHCLGHDVDTIEVIGINCDLLITDNNICLGDSVEFLLNNMLNVDGFVIDYGDGSPFGTTMPVYHTYHNAPSTNLIYPVVVYWSSDSTCVNYNATVIQVDNVRAYFSRGLDGLDKDTSGCVPFTVDFLNQSIGGNSYEWHISDGHQESNAGMTYTFGQAGDYTVTLTVTGTKCTVSESKMIHALPAPDIQLQHQAEICHGDSVQLLAHGGIQYEWSPGATLSDSTSSSPIASPIVTTLYTVTVTNVYTCKKSADVSVFVQQPPYIQISDTTIIIGEMVNVPGTPLFHVEYTWSPSYGLSCDNCYNPVFQPLQTTTYYVTITAFAGDRICYVTHDSITISIEAEYSLDMPDVFTPDGDGVNDVLYVRGWGLKSLIEFKIFDRWGQLLYSSDDISKGWDGTFQGQKQNIDTYVYMVRAMTYGGKVLEKNGMVTLLR